MRKFLRLLSLTLVLVVVLGLSACSSYGKIEKALKKLNYVTSDLFCKQLDDIEDETNVELIPHLMNGSKGSVIILEFESNEDMKECFEDSETLQLLIADVSKDGTLDSFYNSVVNKGYANGNCLVVPLTVIQAEKVAILNAVKNA